MFQALYKHDFSETGRRCQGELRRDTELREAEIRSDASSAEPEKVVIEQEDEDVNGSR